MERETLTLQIQELKSELISVRSDQATIGGSAVGVDIFSQVIRALEDKLSSCMSELEGLDATRT